MTYEGSTHKNRAHKTVKLVIIMLYIYSIKMLTNGSQIPL